MSPVFARNRHGKLYRYYVSASLQLGRSQSKDDVVRRIGATELEKALAEVVTHWLPQCSNPRDQITSTHIRSDGLLIDLPARLEAEVATNLQSDEAIVHRNHVLVRLKVPLLLLPLRGGKGLVIASSAATPRPDASLIAALRKAHTTLTLQRGMPLVMTAPSSQYDRKILRLAFLAPDLQRDILAGHQPPSLNLETLRKMDIPICWKKQRAPLGWHRQG